MLPRSQQLVSEVIPDKLLTRLAAHHRECSVCLGPEEQRLRIETALQRGAVLQSIAFQEGLDKNTIEDHAAYFRSLPIVTTKEHQRLSRLGENTGDSLAIPLETVQMIRNMIIPSLTEQLLKKVTEGHWRLSEGVVVLDMLVRLLKIVRYGDSPRGTEIEDARQQAVGALSELYNKARTPEERQEILDAQRQLLEALRRAGALIEAESTVLE